MVHPDQVVVPLVHHRKAVERTHDHDLGAVPPPSQGSEVEEDRFGPTPAEGFIMIHCFNWEPLAIIEKALTRPLNPLGSELVSDQRRGRRWISR